MEALENICACLPGEVAHAVQRRADGLTELRLRPGGRPLHPGHRTAIRQIMQKAWFVLPDYDAAEKGLVQAHFVDGVSCEELAKRQNTTIGAIRTALARLRKKARRLAEDERT